MAHTKNKKPEKNDAEYETKKLFGTKPLAPLKFLFYLWQISLFLFALYNAYTFRLFAIKDFGMLIHEFDPWFNYRATEYMSTHGIRAFFQWYDYMSWYPIGRPVGSTTYPGLQITSVLLHRLLSWIGGRFALTLNEICCLMPCWGGIVATIFASLIAYETMDSSFAATVTALIFSIIPAHLMRSIGGGYDNECIAVSAMVSTFYFWIRSLRTSISWPFGLLAGLAYAYMAAAWGGYIFVLNMVALHAGVCLVIDTINNRYDPCLHYAYSIFYLVGTTIATFVPTIRYAPFTSLEQISALLVFIYLQAVYFSEKERVKRNIEIFSIAGIKLRIRYIMIVTGFLFSILCAVMPFGIIGSFSVRVKALFLKHTVTGNPLVDSVAEHQPASIGAYWQYLHFNAGTWYFGFSVLFFMPRKRASSFLLLYSAAAYYFSLRMSRLILLSGPVASIISAICITSLLRFVVSQFCWSKKDEDEVKEACETVFGGKNGKNNSGKNNKSVNDQSFKEILDHAKIEFKARPTMRRALATVLFASMLLCGIPTSFYNHSRQIAIAMSQPLVVFKAHLPNGEVITVDDYLQSYEFLRTKTPEDSRVLAWWDYGYQITGIGNRTSLADGNTCNHEHIATIGKMLTSPVKESHSIVRHLADYVLIWAGQRGDDLGKSIHMARIGNSIYHDICIDDLYCRSFGFYENNFNSPTPSMRRSLLYHMHGHDVIPNVKLDTKYFKQVFISSHGLVRVFKVMNVSKESKEWIADPKNHVCDVKNPWICPGQYPPAKEVQEMLAKRTAFGEPPRDIKSTSKKNRK